MKKNKSSNFGKEYRNFLLVVIFILIAFVLVFKIIPDIRQEYVVIANGTTIEKNIVYTCEDNDNQSCGYIRVGGDPWKREWLDKNFQCVKITCTWHYNYSQRAKIEKLNSSRTWDGPIEYTEDGSAIFYEQGAGIVQECQPCEEYVYKDYTIYRK